MKKHLFSVLLVMMMVSSVFAGHKPDVKHGPKPKTKHYVKVKPDNPKIIVIPSPGPKYVWREGHWVWAPAAARYEWREGAWIVPPTQYKVWMPGHWQNTRRGWVWINGHWQ